ncbi:hypothetical protein C7425_11222 [Pantoea ananatis]|nr:hypothetical protein C7425_11222 [Pantoea ananatis]
MIIMLFLSGPQASQFCSGTVNLWSSHNIHPLIAEYVHWLDGHVIST